MNSLFYIAFRRFFRISIMDRVKQGTTAFGAAPSAFTLMELMVSIALVSILMLLVAGTTNAVSKLWRKSVMQTASYSEAREAFDSLTTQLSQLSLQPYWDYVDASGRVRSEANFNSFVPAAIKRQSDLHFIMGPTTEIVAGTGAATHPGHAVFFQKLGGQASGLPFSNLVETAGFFIEAVDAPSDPYTPTVVKNALNLTGQKMRLVEVQALPNDTTVYASTNSSSAAAQKGWISDLQVNNPSQRSKKRVAAENVILLVLRGRLSETADSTGAVLAPDYFYDSRAWVAGTSARTEKTRNTPPPIIDVVMVVLEEDSANRLSRAGELTPSAMGYAGLFANAAKLDDDLHQLEDNLNVKKIGYRVLRASVPVANARWGEN
jgi:uncharacterized protein (TIGR02599 family)